MLVRSVVITNYKFQASSRLLELLSFDPTEPEKRPCRSRRLLRLQSGRHANPLDKRLDAERSGFGARLAGHVDTARHRRETRPQQRLQQSRFARDGRERLRERRLRRAVGQRAQVGSQGETRRRRVRQRLLLAEEAERGPSEGAAVGEY